MAAASSHLFSLFPNTNKEFTLDLVTLRKAEIIIKALNHPVRLLLIKLLHDKEELTVTEMYMKLRLEQSVVSQHLAVLRRAGIVVTRREGKFIYYNMKVARIIEIYKIAKTLI
ncbi:MAG: transcriptional regulator [Bacteroidetes bacterium]|nr:MAG: transcriptional regulator [Bacteroidota bacterium]